MYKLGPSVLLEIIDIVRKGLSEGADVSELMRKIEVSPDSANPDQVRLTDEYLKERNGEV